MISKLFYSCVCGSMCFIRLCMRFYVGAVFTFVLWNLRICTNGRPSLMFEIMCAFKRTRILLDYLILIILYSLKMWTPLDLFTFSIQWWYFFFFLLRKKNPPTIDPTDRSSDGPQLNKHKVGLLLATITDTLNDGQIMLTSGEFWLDRNACNRRLHRRDFLQVFDCCICSLWRNHNRHRLLVFISNQLDSENFSSTDVQWLGWKQHCLTTEFWIRYQHMPSYLPLGLQQSSSR